ncbi:hypothetical protein PG996_008368 [Apiospora saccharicola]|uniref:Uncharacterized protein n=1 Tax=Apiospora saccharicola TaxID=335842 RepID=A0ABR1UXP6_9PEZI
MSSAGSATAFSRPWIYRTVTLAFEQPGRQPTDREWDGFLDKKHTKQTPNSAKLHFTLVSSTGDGICVLFAYANTVYGLKQAAGLQQTEVVFVTGVGNGPVHLRSVNKAQPS